MKAIKLLFILTLSFLPAYPVAGSYIPLRADMIGDQPEAVVVTHNATEVQLEIRLPGLELIEGILEGQKWDRIEIPGCGLDQETGTPELPHFTRLLIIPATAGVRANFEALETTTIPNVRLMPFQEREPDEIAADHLPVQYNDDRYSQNEFYPSQRVQTGPPTILRGLRVVALRTNPVQYNPVTRELKITTRARLTLHFEGTDLRSVPTRSIPLSRSWKQSLAGSAFNLDNLEGDTDEMGSYLIVYPNNTSLLTYLTPFIEWKKRKGHSVVAQTVSGYQVTTTTVKNVIQNAYDTWEVPPEYVLLVGDASWGMGTDYYLPAWPTNDNYFIDHPYSQLDGADILADVSLGRLPAGNSTEAQVVVNKVLFYEKMPYTTNSNWFHQGAVLAGDAAAGISTVQVGRWVKTRMVQHQYTQIDTFWYFMPGTVAQTLTPSLNNGVLFVNYRGNNGMEDFTTQSIDFLTNGRKLPFVVTITCHTGGFQGGYNKSLMEKFADAGTTTTPKGAVASIGTATLDTHTRQNNTVDMGIYSAIYDEGITQAGNALNHGKIELYNTYFAHDVQSVNNYSLWNSLAGDPGLELFTHAIQYMTCNVPDQVTYGVNTLTLTVNETGVGPLNGATVCLYKANEIQSVGLTNGIGQVTLPLTVDTAGNVKVTITKQNFYPIVDSLNVVNAGVAVGYQSHSVDDDNSGGTVGDNDQAVNPGETVDLSLIFKNYGTSTTATSISTTASESDPFVTLSNATQSFPDMAPGASGNSSGAVRLAIEAGCPDGYTIPLAFNTTSNQGSWPGGLTLPVISYQLNLLSVQFSGSDSVLSPGETASLVLTVKNVGHKTASSLTATITSLDSWVTVNDNSASFGTVNIGSSASCNSNSFNLTASASALRGHQAKLKVVFASNYATQTDTLIVPLGIKVSTDPQGPDAYGYYCYDNTDVNFAEHPTFNWVEIAPQFGGSGTQIVLGDYAENEDASALVSLPFTFRYYGQTSNQITVCSNGWISMVPNVSFTDFRNYPIPSAAGPYAMIAPFWDDLMETTTGHVYQRYDGVNHRFIIEWSRLINLTDTVRQIFEVILYDPAYFSTPTGDGPIVFQYHSIASIYGDGDDNPYSTIGIENWDQSDGIESFYWNTYEDPAVAPIQAGRAYKYTTVSPLTQTTPPLDVFLIPQNPPIVIPAQGGSFNYEVGVTNSGTMPQTFNGWVMQYTPLNQWQGPMLGPINLTIPGNLTVSRNRTQNVPSTAPSGVYTYRGYVGVYSTAIKWDSASFQYTKSATAGLGPEVSNWANWGESFAPYESIPIAASEIPACFALEQNQPNPFNPTTAISYQLSAFSHVTLKVYDTAGRLVVTLVDGQKNAGTYQVTFDGSNLASGIYLYTLTAGQNHASGKMVLLK